MIRSTYGNSLYAVGEDDVVFGTVASWTGDQPNGVVFCHGGGDLAGTAVVKDAQRNVMTSNARHATVHVGDLGGASFGNNTGLERVEDAVAYLRAEWGQTGPLVLIGASMGFITASVYALNHPDDVLAITGIIPGIDLADLYTRGHAALIDAAYPPAYNDLTDGPTHSPIQFADQLPEDLPIHLFTASDDPECVPAVTTAWLAARPQDNHTDLGALGHTEAAIAASVAGVNAWVTPFLTPAPLP